MGQAVVAGVHARQRVSRCHADASGRVFAGKAAGLHQHHSVVVDHALQRTTAERGHQPAVVHLVGHRGACDRQPFGGHGNAARCGIAHAVARTCCAWCDRDGIRPARHRGCGGKTCRCGSGQSAEHIAERGQGKHSAAAGTAAEAQHVGARPHIAIGFVHGSGRDRDCGNAGKHIAVARHRHGRGQLRGIGLAPHRCVGAVQVAKVCACAGWAGAVHQPTTV